MAELDVRRDADRFVTDAGDIVTRHSFSYGAHYDPRRIGFGPIRAINTERLAPGAGFAAHQHADVEIVTWVIDGTLRHADSAGGGGLIGPGTVQRLSAGRGVEHTEINDSGDESLCFVQMMLLSGHDGAPAYEQVELHAAGDALQRSVQVHAAAELLVATVAPGRTVAVPAAPRSLVHVTRGRIRLRGIDGHDTELFPGDEAHLTGAGPYDLSAAGEAADTGGEALVWQLET